MLQQRVKALHDVLAEYAYEEEEGEEGKHKRFCEGGAVTAIVEIAFAGWPDSSCSDGFSTSTCWTDEVVEFVYVSVLCLYYCILIFVQSRHGKSVAS